MKRIECPICNSAKWNTAEIINVENEIYHEGTYTVGPTKHVYRILWCGDCGGMFFPHTDEHVKLWRENRAQKTV